MAPWWQIEMFYTQVLNSDIYIKYYYIVSKSVITP